MQYVLACPSNLSKLVSHIKGNRAPVVFFPVNVKLEKSAKLSL